MKGLKYNSAFSLQVTKELVGSYLIVWGEGTGKIVNNTEVRLMMRGGETGNGEVEQEDSGKGM